MKDGKRLLHIMIVAALTLIIGLSLPAYAAVQAGLHTELVFTHALVEPSYFVEASVVRLQGNQNELTITVTRLFSNGSETRVTEVFVISNNAADYYQVGGCAVYVDTKGNIQIRQIYIVR